MAQQTSDFILLKHEIAQWRWDSESVERSSSRNETEQAEIESGQSRDTIGKKNAGLWNCDVLDGTALPKKWVYNFRVGLDHQLSLDLQLAAAMSSALHSYG